MTKSNKYLIISAFTFILGYIYLKVAYNATQETPFLNEIILVVLGTIVTIAITAALLNKQSEVELEKEQRVKIFDIKADLYFELINFIEKIILKSEIDSKDLVTLEFLTHKISIIANPEVLQEYGNFISTVKKTSLDTKISALESDELSAKLATLCGKIRYDLILEEQYSNVKDTQKMIENTIDRLT